MRWRFYTSQQCGEYWGGELVGMMMMMMMMMEGDDHDVGVMTVMGHGIMYVCPIYLLMMMADAIDHHGGGW